MECYIAEYTTNKGFTNLRIYNLKLIYNYY